MAEGQHERVVSPSVVKAQRIDRCERRREWPDACAGGPSMGIQLHHEGTVQREVRNVHREGPVLEARVRAWMPATTKRSRCDVDGDPAGRRLEFSARQPSGPRRGDGVTDPAKVDTVIRVC
jgi:hypothetical protein